jgi:hypothetical protein
MGEYESVKGESIATRDKELGRRLFEEGRAIGRELGVIVELLPADQFEPDRGPSNAAADTRRLRKDCGDLWNKAVIATTGDVMACCAAPSVRWTASGNEWCPRLATKRHDFV